MKYFIAEMEHQSYAERYCKCLFIIKLSSQYSPFTRKDEEIKKFGQNFQSFVTEREFDIEKICWQKWNEMKKIKKGFINKKKMQII